MTPSRTTAGLAAGTLLALSPALLAQFSASEIVESAGALEAPSATFASLTPSAATVTLEGRGMIGVLLADGGGRPRVESVIEGGPAEKAGVQAGDRILSVDGEEVADLEALVGQLRSFAIGEKVSLVVERDGWRKHIDVTLADSEELDLPEEVQEVEEGHEAQAKDSKKKHELLEKLEALGYVGDEDHEHEHDTWHEHEGDDHVGQNVILLEGDEPHVIDLSEHVGKVDLKDIGVDLAEIEGLHGTIRIECEGGEIDLEELKGLHAVHGLHEGHGLQGLAELKHLAGLKTLDGRIEIIDSQGGKQVIVLGEGGGAGECRVECEVQCDSDRDDADCQSSCEVKCDVEIQCESGGAQSFVIDGKNIQFPGGIHGAKVQGTGGKSRGFFFSDDGETHEIEWEQDGQWKAHGGEDLWFGQVGDGGQHVIQRKIKAGKAPKAKDQPRVQWRSRSTDLHNSFESDPRAELEELRAELEALRAEIRELRRALRQGRGR